MPTLVGLSSRRLRRIAPLPFPSRVRRSLGWSKSRFVETSPFRLAAPGRRYEPLYVGLFTAVAQRRISGLFATPEMFGSTQNPLGAVLLPQALATVGHTPLPEGLSITLADLSLTGGTGYRRVVFHPHGTQGYEASLCDWLTIAIAVSHPRRTWSAATPVPSGGTEPPGRLPPAPGSHGDLSGDLTFARGNPLSRWRPLTSRS